MTAKKSSKPAGKTKAALTKEKATLNKEIKSKNAELELLSAKIKDMEALSSKREQLRIEVDELTKAKREVGKLTVSQQSIEKEINILAEEKKQLNAFLKKNKPKKDQLAGELDELSSQKMKLVDEFDRLSEQSKKTAIQTDNLKKERKKFENEIASLKSEYALYPRDLKHLSKEAMNQRKKYLSLAFITLTFILFFILLLGFTLLVSNPSLNWLGESFSENLEYQFWSAITTKVLLAFTLLFLIHYGFKLLAGFINQYIRVRNKITALRAADLLVGYMDDGSKNGENVARRNLKEMKLLQNYLPKIIDMDTAFDHLTAKSKKTDPVS